MGSHLWTEAPCTLDDQIHSKSTSPDPDRQDHYSIISPAFLVDTADIARPIPFPEPSASYSRRRAHTSVHSEAKTPDRERFAYLPHLTHACCGSHPHHISSILRVLPSCRSLHTARHPLLVKLLAEHLHQLEHRPLAVRLRLLCDEADPFNTVHIA